MKVVAFNGSPNKEGNTWHALKLVEHGKGTITPPERENKIYMNFIH